MGIAWKTKNYLRRANSKLDESYAEPLPSPGSDRFWPLEIFEPRLSRFSVEEVKVNACHIRSLHFLQVEIIILHDV